MEEKIKIELEKWVEINGTLSRQKSSKKLVIFIHGLGWSQNDHIFFNWAKFFNENWFNTFRFDLYSGWENSRKLKNCSIKTHSQDLDKVIDFFREDYKEINLIGHSLGGATVLWSKQENISSVTLWDGTYDCDKEMDSYINYSKELDCYIADFWKEIIIWKGMYNEFKLMKGEYLENIKKWTNIICAWNWMLKSKWEKTWLKIHIIEWASHSFNEEWTEEKLFEKTLKLINKNLR